MVFIFRKHDTGGYSIEELFYGIANELAQKFSVVTYNVGSRWMIFFDAWRLWRLKADIYHVTGDVNYMIQLLPHNKSVLTVHDLGHFLNPNGLRGIKGWIYKWVWLIFPIRGATVVTTISTATKNSIMKYLNIPAYRINLVYNCYSSIFKPNNKAFNNTCPIILQVGTRVNKNISRLIEALHGLKCKLVIVGKLSAAIQQKLTEFNIDYENHIGITHEELYGLYCKCDIVSFISTFEGFGVPIIEAQAVGRALITSNIIPMCDIAGDGACIVDAFDISQIHEGICRIINDHGYRTKLVEQGFKNVVRYSPAMIANDYLKLYDKIINDNMERLKCR